MDRTIVSGARAAPLLGVAVVAGVLGVAVLYKDLHGSGLTNSLYFRVFGVFVYPIFYGAVLCVLITVISAIRRRGQYIAVSEGTLSVGKKEIPLGDINDFHVRKNWVGITELIIGREDGANIAVKGYLLTRRLPDVVAELRSLRGCSS